MNKSSIKVRREGGVWRRSVVVVRGTRMGIVG